LHGHDKKYRSPAALADWFSVIGLQYALPKLIILFT